MKKLLHFFFHSWGPWEVWESSGLNFRGEIVACQVRSRFCKVCGNKQEEQVR